MLDTFRNWINMILALGILFTVIRIIVPNTKLKKYIYSLMGIVTIIVILSPVINLIKNGDLENSFKNIFLNMASAETLNTEYTNLSNYEDVNKNNVKENFKLNVKNDIKQKLAQNIDNEIQVEIDITDTYNIDKVTINVVGYTSFDIASFINQEYDIDRQKVIIQKGG